MPFLEASILILYACSLNAQKKLFFARNNKRINSNSSNVTRHFFDWYLSDLQSTLGGMLLVASALGLRFNAAKCSALII
jgi:hypothetical protein